MAKNDKNTENREVFRKEIDALQISESRIVRNQDMKTRHYHDSIELFILLEGIRYFFVDRKIHVIKAGSAILIPPGQIHKTSTYGDDSRHSRFLLQFSREGTEGILQSSYSMSFEEFGQKYDGITTFRSEKWTQLLDTIARLKKEFDHDEPNIPLVRVLSHEILAMYTSEFDYNASMHSESEENTGLVSEVHNSIQQVIEYLNSHYMDEILLDDLSKKFFISRAYLTRNFRKVTGVTIVQYLTVIRVRKACLLLKTTDESITFIAEECGFSNTTYFENVFKRLRGRTPGQYRKMCRSSEL